MFRTHRKLNVRPSNHTFRKQKKYDFAVKSKAKPTTAPSVAVDETPSADPNEPRITKIKKENCEYYEGAWWWRNSIIYSDNVVMSYKGKPLQHMDDKYIYMLYFKNQETRPIPVKKTRVVIDVNAPKRTAEGLEQFRKAQWMKIFMGPNGDRLHNLSENIVQVILSFTGIVENHADYRLLKYGFHPCENKTKTLVKFAFIRCLIKSTDQAFIERVKYLRECSTLNTDRGLMRKINYFIHEI